MKIAYALKRHQHHDAFIGLSKSWFAKCFKEIVQVTCGLDIDTYMGQLHFYQLTKEEK